jgi:hypothetical protein
MIKAVDTLKSILEASESGDDDRVLNALWHAEKVFYLDD